MSKPTLPFEFEQASEIESRTKNSKRRAFILSQLQWRVAVLAGVAVVFTAVAWHTASADEDLVHIVKGTVKSIDKDSKTMVVKTAD